MQYTIRNIPKLLDQALREKARKDKSSINETAIQALTVGLRAMGQHVKKRDLSWIVGTWVDDPAFEEAMKDFSRIDYEQWGLPDPNRAGHQPVHRPTARRAKRRRSA
ncbi:MAG TPA: hypothetical protein VF669_13320 [Tepidisphaeraceae bacterium]|jgi:hypothetical protein